MRDEELRGRIPDTFDNTMIAQWHKCPRSFYWFMRGLDYPITPPYFTWGRAFGAGLNVWHHLQGKMDYVPRIAEAVATAQVEWEKDAPNEDKTNNWDNLERTLILYSTVYREIEPWRCAYEKGELGFRFPIPGTEVYYAGAIDDPIEWPSYGLLFREDKTTGAYLNTEGVDAYALQWEFASQIKGYAWAFKFLLGEAPFGAYMNMISKATRKEPELRFKRILIQNSAWELDQFIKETVLLIDDIRREFDRWSWPKLGMRDPINCVGGMGRSACLYRRICKIEMEPWDLEDKYNFDEEFIWRSVWKPWERKGENE